MAICLTLRYCKTNTFPALTTDSLLSIVALVNNAVLLAALCHIFCVWVDKTLASLSFSMVQLH